MTDLALLELFRQFADLPAPVWWFAGEQAERPPTAVAGWQVFTNRCDTAKLFEAAGYPVALGDFQLPDRQPQAICYRVAKEKAQVHYLINQAAVHLPEDGVLLLAGFKGEGLKTYADKASRLLGGASRVNKLAGGVYIARIHKASPMGAALPDQEYETLRPIAENPRLVSKPGVFGWQKIDRGSALLIEQLPRFLAEFEAPPRRWVDLGCGYGYLPVMAHRQLPDSQWLLTDNNATALLACAENCHHHNIAARLLLADCAEGEAEQFPALVCNPPFHQGFAVEGELSERFLNAAHRLLEPGGRALFVVNQFIPLQRKAAGLFADSQLLLSRDGFNIVVLRKA